MTSRNLQILLLSRTYLLIKKQQRKQFLNHMMIFFVVIFRWRYYGNSNGLKQNIKMHYVIYSKIYRIVSLRMCVLNWYFYLDAIA